MPTRALALALVVCLAAGARPGPARAQTLPPRPESPPAASTALADPDQDIQVFSGETIHWVKGQPLIAEADGYVLRHVGHTVERTLDLPDAPERLEETRRILAEVRVEAITDEAGRPHDRWTRLGNVSVLVPEAPEGQVNEVELVRFVTGYGAGGTFVQDVTALAPLLHGRQTLRVFLMTYSTLPGWRVSVRLRYTTEGAGQRWPRFAAHLFHDPHLEAEAPRMRTTLTIPPGLEVPRIRILTSGHASDGRAEHEFASCTHVLRVDGREIARWRPWSERGGGLRRQNPWAGRRDFSGREIWASDYDRTNWHPGLAVEPLFIPVPELTAGEHTIELEVLGIRPKAETTPDGKRHHGFWTVSAAVVADAPWPWEDE